MKKRVLSLLLAAVLLVGLMPAAAGAANAGGAQGVVDAAKNYLEKANGAVFDGGSNNWCGRFLWRCAEDAGETAALCGSVDTLKSTFRAMAWFVENGAQVGYFYSTIKISDYGLNTSHLMDKVNYSPKVGDIIFYDWDGNPTGFDHMEVVSSVSGSTITTIGGSTGSSCDKWPVKGELHVHAHTYNLSSKYIVAYARPAYSSAGTTTPPGNTVGTSAAVDTSYKNWSQGDSRWGSNTTSSKGSGYSMASVGCLVTAIAKILVHSGQQDQASFNPDTCRQALLDTGMLSASGGILYLNYNKTFLPTYAPELRHESSSTHSAWSQSTAVSTISDKIDTGYYVIVCVKNKDSGNTHWMAVDYVGDDIYVMDNGGVVALYGTKKYSGGVIDQVYFKYSGDKSYPAIGSTIFEPVPLSINPTTEPSANMKQGSPFYFRGSITSGSTITSATVSILGADGSTVVQTKTVYPNATSVDILKGGLDSLSFGKLAVGGYYLYLTATDASGETAEWIRPFSIRNGPWPPLPLPTIKTYQAEMYRDVTTGDWFHDNVAAAYELGLMVGLNATTFAPNDDVTIAQSITMAARIHRIYQAGVMDITSYESGNWYDVYVDYARNNGLIDTDYSGQYDRAATREEFVHILARALPESELQTITQLSFADAGSITYLSDVQRLSSAGIINGYTQNGLSYFDPAGHITRAQAAAIICRMARPDTRVGR